MATRLLLTTVIGLFAVPVIGAQDSASRRVQSVPAVDLTRYAGKWYEIARLPNWFQKNCAKGTTADYERLSDGEIRVVNACVKADGRPMRAEGRAKLADKRGPTSRLKVRFAPGFLSFLPFVWGDYWVLDLPDDYSTALVGTPNHDYLWILSRTPQLDDATYQRIVEAAASQGFDVARLMRSGQ
jgi:apolipoprotein D and lipocalin family protein